MVAEGTLEPTSCCGALYFRRRHSRLENIDRGHSLGSLSLPPAAVASLPSGNPEGSQGLLRKPEKKKRPLIRVVFLFLVRENITDYFTLQRSFNGTEHTFSMAFYKVLRFLIIDRVILLRKNDCRYKTPLGWASISFR